MCEAVDTMSYAFSFVVIWLFGWCLWHPDLHFEFQARCIIQNWVWFSLSDLGFPSVSE